MCRRLLSRVPRLAFRASLLALLAGCDDGPAPIRPVADFLVAAGDSIFWVRSDTAGVRLRGSPMLLAHDGGRFHEIYVADDDRSYYDAVLIGQRIYRRDLVTGDSTLVFQDSEVPALARAYATAHPGETPLLPEEDASEDPSLLATAELELLDLHGPYLSYEYHSDVRLPGRELSHSTRRGVVDLRTGRAATLAALFGRAEGHRTLTEGRQRFAATVDSLRAARDPRAARAREALGAFAFDARSFSLVSLGREPAVEFLVPGLGERAGGAVLPLAPVPVRAPEWWAAVREAFPEPLDSLAEQWAMPHGAVLARYDSAGESVSLALRDSAGNQWSLGQFPAPARRVIWLDRLPLDGDVRRALVRAFDESAFYSDEVRSASLDRSRRAHPGATPAILVRHRPTAARERAPHAHRPRPVRGGA